MNNKRDNGSALYNNEHVFVKIEWGHKRVCIHDIVYLEAQQNYCVIHLLKGNEKSRMMVTVPMCEVLEDMNPDLFVRIHLHHIASNDVDMFDVDGVRAMDTNKQVWIHRSYAVNIEHINVIASYMVQMDNGKDINIGREYRNNLEDMFVFIGSRKRVKEKKFKTDNHRQDG